MIKYGLSILLLCWSCCCSAWAQAATAAGDSKMTVVHVSGGVRTVGGGKPLVLGQLIAPTDKIMFLDGLQRVVLWDPAGRLVGLEPPAGTQDAKALTGTVASFEHAIPEPSHPARKEHFSSFAQLAAQFQGRKYLLLGRSWLIADAPMRLDADTIMLIKFTHAIRDYQLPCKLEYHGDSLIFDLPAILKLNGEAIDPAQTTDYRLIWCHKPTKYLKEMASFQFVWADEEQLRLEISRLLKLMDGRRPADRRMAVRRLIDYGWGEPDEHVYLAWIHKYFPELVVVDAPLDQQDNGKKPKRNR